MRSSARRIVPLILLLAMWLPLRGQVPYGASELQLALQKLNVLGSVLYISAHPDDENTALLASMAKDRHLRTGYLSITRGEGGQNLIGPEQGDALGIIRTQELLAARRIDGAEQFFTRAIDFGYSKSTEETLAMWGREEILSDVVWVIRRFRPDVIITRFTPERGGHGHHTASAELAYEAFRASADSARFPEQLRFVRPWQARRIFWNVFRFSRGSGDQVVGPALIEELGNYSPLLGLSMGEVAGRSRSMHKSQGFGAMEIRGTWTNAFQFVDGDTTLGDLMGDIDISWNRIQRGDEVGKLLRQAADSFDQRQPSSVLPLLMEAGHLLEHLPQNPWIDVKRTELKDAILGCTGVWVDAVAASDRVVAGSSLEVTATVLNRSNTEVRLDRVGVTFLGADSVAGRWAPSNVPLDVRLRVTLPDSLPPTQPYWLTLPREQGKYAVQDPLQIGEAQAPPVLRAEVELTLQDRRLVVDTPVRHRWVDPARGELYRPLVIVPPLSLSLKDDVVLSVAGGRAEVAVIVSNAVPGIEGTVTLETPHGWSMVPGAETVRFDSNITDQTVVFHLTPGTGATDGWIRASVSARGRTYTSSLRSISYDHFESQTFFEPAQARLLNLVLRTNGKRLGYIEGSGDQIPRLLSQIGYTVELLSDEYLETGDLGEYDVIVAGVRAYNVRPVLRSSNHRLMDYVKEGGRYVVQYVTRQELDIKDLGPYPFTVSRGRVSREDAPIDILQPDHPLLRNPNVITGDDFQGWIQERGLYFAGDWDPRYETVLASHDPGEDPLAGGLLYGGYGRGYFVYTGYSWFRQLPAGVPGAFRLFVNLLSQDVSPE